MFDKRLIATITIWSAVIMLFIVIGAAGREVDWDATGITIMAMILASISTVVIWVFGSLDSRHKDRSGEKAKREGDARVQLLLQLLDEDEKRLIKQRLMNSTDGELPLDALLESEKYHQR